jgi:hypothetical protein
VGTGFPKRSCSNKKIERDDDSKKSHPALADLILAARIDRAGRPHRRPVLIQVGEIAFQEIASRSFAGNRR